MLRKGGCLLRRAVIAASVCVALEVVSLPARAQTYSFDLPSQSLSASLREYARISSQQIIFTETLVAGKTAPALHGSYGPSQALSLLLAGSGLTVERSIFGAAMIRKERAAEASRSSPPPESEALAVSVETVMATGTRIVANGYEAPTPVTALAAEDLNRNTPESLAAGLEQLPQFTMTAGANVAN